jgi:hypothetical protein
MVVVQSLWFAKISCSHCFGVLLKLKSNSKAKVAILRMILFLFKLKAVTTMQI